MQLSKAKRLVVKVGSSLIVGEDNQLRKDWLATVAEDIAALKNNGTQVIVVTSGAVALGRNVMGVEYHNKILTLEEKQAAAACGQTTLMAAGWAKAFQFEDIGSWLYPAQILLTIDDTENRRRYLNARNTLETLLTNKRIVPVINENDTVATAELRFGDNDRLAARVAQMASADALILLSDIDGLYTGNPHLDKNAVLIPKITEITAREEAYATVGTSLVGTGGMITKIEAARIALAAGCHMIITSGKRNYPLTTYEKEKHTWFVASSTPKSARKHWISGSIAPAGVIIVDDGAATALAQGKSLLPAGVREVKGHFGRGDAVILKDLKGRELGKGLIAYSSEDTLRILGHKSQDIERILGFKGRNVLIHRDDLVLR